MDILQHQTLGQVNRLYWNIPSSSSIFKKSSRLRILRGCPLAVLQLTAHIFTKQMKRRDLRINVELHSGSRGQPIWVQRKSVLTRVIKAMSGLMMFLTLL
jgi:hypothetical protein